LAESRFGGDVTWCLSLQQSAVFGVGVQQFLELVPGATHFWNGASDVAAIVQRSVEFLRAHS